MQGMQRYGLSEKKKPEEYRSFYCYMARVIIDRWEKLTGQKASKIDG